MTVNEDFVSVLWIQMFSTKPNITVLCMKIVGKDFWNTKFFPNDFFTVPWDKKNSTVKRDMPCLVHRSFFAARTFAKHRKVPNEIFQYCVTKTFRRKNVISSSLIHTKFLLPGNFWSTQEFHWNFLVMWDKTISSEERDIPFYQPNNFSLTKVFWNTEEFPMKIFGNVRRRNFDGKTWYPPLIHKLFQYQRFSENLNGPLKKFSALSDEKSWRKIVNPPSRLAIYFLPLQKFSGKQKAQLMKFFVLVLWGKMFST